MNATCKHRQRMFNDIAGDLGAVRRLLDYEVFREHRISLKHEVSHFRSLKESQLESQL